MPQPMTPEQFLEYRKSDKNLLEGIVSLAPLGEGGLVRGIRVVPTGSNPLKLELYRLHLNDGIKPLDLNVGDRVAVIFEYYGEEGGRVREFANFTTRIVYQHGWDKSLPYVTR